MLKAMTKKMFFEDVDKITLNISVGCQHFWVSVFFVGVWISHWPWCNFWTLYKVLATIQYVHNDEISYYDWSGYIPLRKFDVVQNCGKKENCTVKCEQLKLKQNSEW